MFLLVLFIKNYYNAICYLYFIIIIGKNHTIARYYMRFLHALHSLISIHDFQLRLDQELH